MKPVASCAIFASLVVPCLAAAGDDPKGPAWLASLTEAEAAARKSNKPLLVKIDAEYCVWCKKLDEEFAKSEVAAKLPQFVLVKLDAGRDTEDARRLNVAGTPALRVLSPRGRLTGSHDGFLPAAELAKWLVERRSEATALPEADLASTGPPGALEVVRIVRVLRNRDATLREAALTRLRPHPKESAPATAAAFRDGNLQARLGALELLRSWQAPTAELDPWQPESLTKDRLAAIDAWVRTTIEAKEVPAWEPTADELAAAERDIDTLTTAGEADAVVLRERLAKFGARLLPSVTARLQATEDDTVRERLSALRYRLAAGPARVLDWPGGVERLASRNLEERRRAVDELVRRAAPQDQALLLELFGDPDPLVRELSLRGLQTAAGDAANAALVKLLADPEPNVRAAVLKQWAEKPTPQLLPELKKYVAAEKDADLLVHAVRVLRELKSAAVAPLLIGLLKHEAWQVRAEAAEALAKSIDGRHTGNSGSGDPQKADAYAAFIELLGDEDGFVASRAVEGLRGTDLPAAAKPLLEVAKSRPELAAVVIDVVAAGDVYRKAGTATLRDFTAHESSAVRAAAISGLTKNAEIECEKELLACLADKDVEVRIAAARGVWNQSRAKRTPDIEEIVFEPQPSLLSRLAGSLFGGGAAPPQAKVVKQEEKKEEPPKPKEPPVTSLLRKMVAAEDERETIAAATALAGLGFAEEVLGTLEAAVKKNESLIYELGEALPAMDWEHRKRMFRSFVASSPDHAASAAYYLVQKRDERATDLLWDLIRDPRTSPDDALGTLQSLQSAYLGSNYYDKSQTLAGDRKRLESESLTRLRRGEPLERVVALALLAVASPGLGAKAARDVLNADVELWPDLRQLALRIVLLAGDPREVERTALVVLETDEKTLYAPALALLAGDFHYVTNWSGHGYFLSDLRNDVPYDQRENRATSSKPFDPAVPKGLTIAHLRRAAKARTSPEEEYVQYLRILMNDSENLFPLKRRWEKEPDDDTGRRLLTRAIAYLDDPANIPLLEQIFAKLNKGNNSDTGDFYWTIRIMNGPEIVEFRKRVRDEVGFDKLR